MEERKLSAEEIYLKQKKLGIKKAFLMSPSPLVRRHSKATEVLK